VTQERRKTGDDEEGDEDEDEDDVPCWENYYKHVLEECIEFVSQLFSFLSSLVLVIANWYPKVKVLFQMDARRLPPESLDHDRSYC